MCVPSLVQLSLHSLLTRLSCPQPVSRAAPQPQNDESFYRKLELEDAIKREQLEVFALEQLKADKEAEVRPLYLAKSAGSALLTLREPARRSPPSPPRASRRPAARRAQQLRAAAASPRSSPAPAAAAPLPVLGPRSLAPRPRPPAPARPPLLPHPRPHPPDAAPASHSTSRTCAS